jgi:methionyl-tRNA formyltransferase
MGTPDFAVPSLRIVHEAGYEIAAVITAPDKPAGRGRKLKASPVKEYAESVGLKIMQPTNLKNSDFQDELRSLEANLQIVVAFRMLPEAVWAMPEIGTFNLHGSLLPQYRGAAPIHWAVINGEKETGVTTFFLKHEIDTGDLLFQDKEPIQPEDTTGSVYTRLMEKGAKLVLQTVKAIEQGDYQSIPQNNAQNLKHAPKLFKENTEIDFSKPGQVVCDLIRGLNPFPTAWTSVDGQNMKVYWADFEADANSPEPGIWQTDGKTFLRVSVTDGWVYLKDVQLSSRKRMAIDALLRGWQPNLNA